MILNLCLLAPLFVGSVVVWLHLLKRAREQQSLLDWNEGFRARWLSIPEMVVAYIALLWMVTSLMPRYPQPEILPQKMLELSTVALQATINFGLAFILPLALVSGGRSLASYGMTASNFVDQIRVGMRGFFAAVIPMAISMAVTLPFRGRETQHSLLKLLTDSPDPGTVAIIAITAAVSAPLAEEMLFRVILQGWLSTLFPPAIAISTVAVLFGLVHGWRDGLALLPLAFILGYVFHRRHSYLAVVVIHALFNATMLVLQLINPQTPT